MRPEPKPDSRIRRESRLVRSRDARGVIPCEHGAGARGLMLLAGFTGSRQLAARGVRQSVGDRRPRPGVWDRRSSISKHSSRVLAALPRSGLRWYLRTPPAERMSWGGLFACAGLGLAVLFERAVRLRRLKIIPADFTARFLDRLHEGKLDGGKALDYCEMNPSPAARVALAAVRQVGPAGGRS